MSQNGDENHEFKSEEFKRLSSDHQAFLRKRASVRALQKLLASDSEGWFERANVDGGHFVALDKLETCLVDAKRDGVADIDTSGLEELIEEMDVNKDGSITILEFNAALAAHRSVLPPRERWIHSGDMIKKVAAQAQMVHTRFTVLTKTILYISKHFDVSGKMMADGDVDPAMDEAFRQSFRKFDKDGSGTIDRKELQAAMEEMHLFTTQENFDKVFASLDTDCSGSLDFEEFLAIGRRCAVSRQIIDFVHLDDVQAVELEELEENLELRILTTEDGRNRGRAYVFEVPPRQGREWVDRINKAVYEAKKYAEEVAFKETYGGSHLDSLRARARIMHGSDAFQSALAFVIVSGLIVDIVATQMMPEEGSPEVQTFFIIDVAITIYFLVELCINIFGNSHDGFRPFYSYWWNWFDALIVITSIINIIVSLFGLDLPNFKLLRLLRVGRVIRLFHALKTLRRLLYACACALEPVCLYTCVYMCVRVRACACLFSCVRVCVCVSTPSHTPVPPPLSLEARVLFFSPCPPFAFRACRAARAALAP